MEAHPITDYLYRWVPALAYLAWFIVGTVSMYRTNVIVAIAGVLFWLSGSFMICDIMVRIAGIAYIPFAPTIPFCLLFGIPFVVSSADCGRHFITNRKFHRPEAEKAAPLPQEESIDRITVKDGSRIHIIKVEDLLYIQACGDYATLVTSDGEYIKEQTMKNFETHLPADNFVRIHRSSIVNVTQISRVEQYGKETYQVTLKSGVKLRVSLSRYRLLKERLGI